jgi:hypothetical protein
MRWEVMSVMPVITADIMSRMVPAIMAVAHPEDRAEDHGSQGDQGRQDGQSWDEVLGRRALTVPASWR